MKKQDVNRQKAKLHSSKVLHVSGEWKRDRSGGKKGGQFRGYSGILTRDDGGPD